jgi:hypothetical protein
MIEAEARRVPELADCLGRTEPRLIAFNEYASVNGREVAAVQVHPDVESMELHLRVVAERAARASEETRAATVDIPRHVGGFTRPLGG